MDTPFPIPNKEVKHVCADGTAIKVEEQDVANGVSWGNYLYTDCCKPRRITISKDPIYYENNKYFILDWTKKISPIF